MAKIIELPQMRKMMKSDVPECNWRIWPDSKHANLYLPNGTEMKLTKIGPKLVSVEVKMSGNEVVANESDEFTEKVARLSGQNLQNLTYEQLVEVVKAMLRMKKHHVKHSHISRKCERKCAYNNQGICKYKEVFGTAPKIDETTSECSSIWHV